MFFSHKDLKNKNQQVTAGILGLCIGDALGVPVEFKNRKYLKKRPIKEMTTATRSSHVQTKGTWSDDSSMTLCLLDSLSQGYNLEDIGKKFLQWYYEGLWTPNGTAYDIGETTYNALSRLHFGVSPKSSGECNEKSNGNGSLMRILPLAFYLENCMDNNEKFKKIEEVSGITHNHIRSKIACSIYVEFAINLLKDSTPTVAYTNMQKTILEHYTSIVDKKDLKCFDRILKDDISKLEETDIKSDGYVVHTLEASLWSFFNSSNFREAVLTAVNLGDDTDTTGAVTGGISGIYYKNENIPLEWINQLARKNDILSLVNKFTEKVYF